MPKPAIFITRETALRYAAQSGAASFQLVPAIEKAADKTRCLGFQVAILNRQGVAVQWIGEPANA